MIKPKQRVSKSVKNTKEWKDANSWFFYHNCGQRSLTKAQYDRLHRIAAGEVSDEDYSYVTDPLGVAKTRPELAGTPAKVRNMDIITPVILRLMGEKTKRPNQYVAYSKNSDFPGQQQQRQFELWQGSIHTSFVNEMIKLGMFVPGSTDEQGQPIQEPKSREEIMMETSNMPDWMAVMAAEALEYIRSFNELDRNFRKGFYDWIVTNSVFSYKDVRYDDTVYEIVPGDQLEWMASEGTDFLEDADAVKRIRMMSINQVIDNFRDIEGMTDEILEELECFSGGFSGDASSKYFSQSEVFYQSLFGTQSLSNSNADDVEVCHIVWKSQAIVKKVSGVNVLGETYEIEYDDEYIPDEGETVKESVHSEVWETYILAGKYVVGTQPLVIARESMSNPSLKKLPYNGRIFHSRGIRAKSLIEKGEEFQKKYNIVYYFLEKVMNKNKDKISLLPLSMIPNKAGWDELTTMYYADTLGFLFIDDSDPKALQALQYVKVLDMSLSQYIQYIYQQLQQIKMDWEELAGINPERKGQNTNDAVGNNKLAAAASVISTEELFVEYDEFEEKELTGLLDISKFAFKEGKKATYTSSDGKIKYLEIVPEAYMLMDAGVFVKNGGQEAEKLRQFKESAFAFAQNSMLPSTVAKVVNANNLDKLVLEMQEAERELEAKQQASQQALNQIEQDKITTQQQQHEDNLNFQYYKTELDNNTKLEIALQQPNPVGNDGEILSKERTEAQWQQIENKKAELKFLADKYKADKSLEVARENKQKGEK